MENGDRATNPEAPILGQNAMGLPPGSVVDSRDPRLRQGNLPADPEPRGVTVWCSECGEAVVIRDVHAYVLGLHQRVCHELERVNGVDA
jgi:hypothetical protein